MGSAGESKKFLASSALLRTRPNAVPWRSLVPERVAADITPPALRPYAALYALVNTRNSSSVSRPRSTPAALPGVLLFASLMSAPSSRKLT